MKSQWAEAVVLMMVILWLGRLYFRRPVMVLPFMGLFLGGPMIGLVVQAAGVDAVLTEGAEWGVVASSVTLLLVMVIETWRPSVHDREIAMLAAMSPTWVRAAEGRGEERAALRHRADEITARLMAYADAGDFS